MPDGSSLKPKCAESTTLGLGLPAVSSIRGVSRLARKSAHLILPLSFPFREELSELHSKRCEPTSGEIRLRSGTCSAGSPRLHGSFQSLLPLLPCRPAHAQQSVLASLCSLGIAGRNPSDSGSLGRQLYAHSVSWRPGFTPALPPCELF